MVWLLTWIAATVAFLSIPGIAIAARYYRGAHRAGVESPAVFVAGCILSSMFPRRAASPASVLPGRVFVSWDVRWHSAGRGLALAQPDSRAVTLIFETAQDIGSPATTFTFEPQFRRGSAVHGIIGRGTQGEGSAVVRSLGI